MRTALLVAATVVVAVPAAADPIARPIAAVPGPTATIDLSRTSADVGPAAISRSGTLVFDVAITVKSSLGTTPIVCTAQVNHGAAANYVETSSKTATRSGSTATCRVTIPYLWPDTNPASPAYGTLTVSAGRRIHLRSLPAFAVPAQGATTRFTDKVVL